MARLDAFSDLARHYDVLMAHVDYDHWFMVTRALSQMLPRPFKHLDAGSGTGILVRKLRQIGWESYGLDLSPAMIKVAKKEDPFCALCVGDMRTLPFQRCFQCVTSLFDSINFLLTPEDVRIALEQLGSVLTGEGIVYFDIITERMVLEHFAGQDWSENNGRFSTAWHTDYSSQTRIAETRIRVNRGPVCIVRERAYTPDQIESLACQAGLDILGVFDAPTWRPPKRRSLRIDFVAARGASRALRKAFRSVSADLRSCMTP